MDASKIDGVSLSTETYNVAFFLRRFFVLFATFVVLSYTEPLQET